MNITLYKNFFKVLVFVLVKHKQYWYQQKFQKSQTDKLARLGFLAKKKSQMFIIADNASKFTIKIVMALLLTRLFL